MQLTLVVVLSLVAYRVTSFLILDSLIDEPRRAVTTWVARRRHFRPFWLKVHDLLTCPRCLSVWVSGAAVWTADLHGSVAEPVYVWLAVAAGALIIRRWIEE